jgi:hypothetical protein
VIDPNRSLLTDPAWVADMAERLVVDNPFPAVNVAIALRDLTQYAPARTITEKILAASPDYPFALFEMAILETRARRNLSALGWAERACAAAPDNVVMCAHLAYLLGAAGDPRMGIRRLNDMTPVHPGDHDLLLYAIQYLRFIERFPHDRASLAAKRMEASGRYLDRQGVADHIMAAIGEARPYCFLRTNDGEGAWTFVDPEDEALYPDLFRANRRMFAVDWFGTDEWLSSPAFHAFARKLGDVVAASDLLAVGEHLRLFDEYDLMGTRGLPGQVNHLRKLGWLDPVVDRWNLPSDARYCSSNVHADLFDTGFYPALMQTGRPMGVITSYRGLPEVMRAAGARVEHAIFVPGDSRNFWTDGGQTLRQWPDVFETVCAQLRTLDLRGVVFIMSAGFVGKQYLPILKAQGAVALDVGSMTNRWMERGAVC